MVVPIYFETNVLFCTQELKRILSQTTCPCLDLRVGHTSVNVSFSLLSGSPSRECPAELKKKNSLWWWEILTDRLSLQQAREAYMFVHRKRSGRMFIWKISGNRWSVYLFSSGGEIQLVCSLLTGSLFMATTNVVLYKSPALNPSFTTVWGGADTINRNTSPYNALQFNSATNYYLQNDC